MSDQQANWLTCSICFFASIFWILQSNAGASTGWGVATLLALRILISEWPE